MSATTVVNAVKNTSVTPASGRVLTAFGNLLTVTFEGSLRQGEVATIDPQGLALKAEVLEINGTTAKLQVFEDTSGVQCQMHVAFSGVLLEAELGPGLLSAIFDGLQNPLNDVAAEAGVFLPRGLYLPPLDRTKLWPYNPTASVGTTVTAGDILGSTIEGRFDHPVMVPFRCFGSYTITWIAPAGSYTIDTVIARAVDVHGYEHEFSMIQRWPIKNTLCRGERVKPTTLMDVGLRVLDTQLPIVKGGTFCSPGPFGAGKTVLQHHLAKYAAVDVVVVVACGERAGEVVEMLREFPHLIDPHTGETLQARTVMICNTSSMPVAARESSVYMGMTIAEYYRQMGLDVLLLADSTSRWAQAMREMSGRLEEIPGDEAFPAYLASRIAEFYERGGVISLPDGRQGSITVGGSVSPAGGNFEEPVTQATLAVVGAFLGLSRQRSDARRYPAIDPLISWSTYTKTVGDNVADLGEGWNAKVKLAERLLRQGHAIGKRMEVVGEEGTSLSDFVTYLKAELYDFCYLQQNAFDSEDAYCPLKRQTELFQLIHKVFEKHYTFNSHDTARSYFLNLQHILKNMNYLAKDSDSYKEQYQKAITLIAQSEKGVCDEAHLQ
jgi:V/A-type H+-transporting ATPase subunit A